MARRETERDTYGGARRWAEGAGESWTGVEKAGAQHRERDRSTDPVSARWHGSEQNASGSGGILRQLSDELGLSRPSAVPEPLSDAEIREDVCERLWREAHLDVSEVSVEVLDAVVTLDGTVPHRQMKHAIEDLVASCEGVQDVDNRIRVLRDAPSVGPG